MSHRRFRLARLPSSGGIAPLNKLLPRLSLRRLVRYSSSGGILPLNWLLQRVRPVTRPSLSVVTPYHRPIGSSLSQFVVLFHFGPPVVL